VALSQSMGARRSRHQELDARVQIEDSLAFAAEPVAIFAASAF